MLNDIFDSLFSSADAMTMGNYFICMLVSLALGALIAVCSMYKPTTRSRSLTVSLVLLPMIVQTIIALVNGQVGAGIAVAGAFSLVRFRSAPASARDITSIFLAMAVGLANGMGYIGIAVILTVVVLVVNFLLAALGFGGATQRERDLKIVIPESLNYTDAFDDLFRKYTSRHELLTVKTTNMGSLYKLSYHIVLKNPNREKEFIDAIRCRNGNLEIICSLSDLGGKDAI
ncbi:MAG: DUF4956 domain-containing protein [Christensenellaceae bacterium]|nr:DUF4956 domain-containing protein [Christensenellaceae bacterium]